MIMEPKNWNVYLFRDILERVEVPVNVESNKEYVQIGIRSHGKGLFYKEPVLGKALGNKQVFWIQPNCFILNVVFAWEQAITKTTENEIGMIGSHRFPMYRPKNDLVDIDYLIYYFLTKRGTDILEAASPGGAGWNRTLGQERFLKSKITLPTLPEQQKIAAILSTQDKVIELKENLLVQKQQQKKYLMQQLLAGKKRLPGFCEKWTRKQLGELFENRVEINRSDLGLLAITSTRGILPRDCLDLKDNSSEDKSKYLRICPGDIGYNTMRMWQGVSAYSEYEGIVSPAYTILAPMEGVYSRYFAYLFKTQSVIFSFYRFSQGLVDDTRNLKYENFKKISVSIPSNVAEQRAIVQILSTADHEIDLLQKSIEAEKQKKKALMQLLITGKVRRK
mgnify:CR=1 FL=1